MARTLLVSFLLPFFLLSCSGGTTSSTQGNGAIEAARVSAARETAKTNTSCTTLGDFYWEIGNSSDALVSGSDASSTVNDCGTIGTNDDYTPANLDKFFYNGGHYQKWAVDNGLGLMTATALGNEFRNTLGSNILITFGSPHLAGAIATTASSYITFLRKILTKQLRIGNFLGADVVCTQPGSPGCSAVSSPLDEESAHYSYGHWVEDDPTFGDGSFSSGGALGFYPWIDSTKKLYGVIARSEAPSGGADELGNGYASMLCARKIRESYRSAVVQ